MQLLVTVRVNGHERYAPVLLANNRVLRSGCVCRLAACEICLRGKTVLITGSRGLGLALAYELVTHKNEIELLVRQLVERFGRLDVLVNNAGEIQVGAFDSLEHSDFEHAMDLMFWAPVNLTFAVLPEMKRQGGGQIVNVTSVGGRVSVPHLLPYSCAKFAFVGFSDRPQ